MKTTHNIRFLFVLLIAIISISVIGCGGSGGSGNSDNTQDTTGDGDSSDDTGGETAGFTISAINGNTSEDGTTAEFTFKLNSQPDGDVIIDVASSDTGEGTVSASELTFTTSNWSSNQTVTVTGIDDSLADGSQEYTIQLSIDTANTTDTTGYASLDPDDVSVTNTDNDSAGFTFSSIDSTTSEEGATGSFSLKLNTEPDGNVVVSVTSSDEGEGTVSVSALTFTPSNWSTNQTVTVTGERDYDIDDNQDYAINLSIDSGLTADTTGYTSLDPDDISMTNANTDTKLVLSGITTTSDSITLTWSDPTYSDFDHVAIAVDGTTTQIGKDVETFTKSGLDSGSVYAFIIVSVDESDISSDEHTIALSTTGSGTLEYTTVATSTELNNVRNDLDGGYLLTADLDLSDYASGEGWVPIGDDTNKFAGYLIGNTHIISNLTINRPSSSYQGLFGYVDTGGIVNNLGLENVDITGDEYVGGVAGYANEGTRTHYCYVEGNLSGESRIGGLLGDNRGVVRLSYANVNVTASSNNAGGLAGKNSRDGIIVWSYATGSVNASSGTAGGLVGSNDGYEEGGDIIQCYADVNVTGTQQLGGLAGYQYYGLIRDSYATGSVTGTSEQVGGLVGFHYRFSTINRSYAIGNVSGSGTLIGGLVGKNDSATTTISNSFWDTETTGQSASQGGTGKTSSEMKVVATFTDETNSSGLDAAWDFVGDPSDDSGTNDFWSIDSSINSGYPYLTDLQP